MGDPHSDVRIGQLLSGLEHGWESTGPARPLDRLRRALPRAIPRTREALTFGLRPVAAVRFRRLADRRPLRLHIGSGFVYKDGWVNVDLAPARVDLPWNLKRGIPFADASTDAVFHEHLLEHIPMPGGLALLRECHRVLRPGGVLRIGVPDAGLALRSYAGQASPDWALSQATPMLSVQALFYSHGHAAMYDDDTLTLLCRAAGFASAEQREFGESGIVPCPDTSARKSGTLYVEAVKGSR